MADPVISPAINPVFDSNLRLSDIGQISFRGQEPWGRWLLGHQAKLVFSSPGPQEVELDFRLSLPYEGQWVELVLNGQVVFRGLYRPQAPGDFNSRLLIEVQRGVNTLEVLTNRSNRDGLGPPFAKEDSSNISVGLQQLDFKPVQVQPHLLYGPQPSGFIGAAYSSAGLQGLEKLTNQRGPLTVEYRLLRRFEHQGFTFALDGKPVHRLPVGEPGNLLVGQFDVPAAALSSAELHVLKVSSSGASSAKPFLTTAQDAPDVQFYVQQLELKPTAPNIQINGWAVGLLVLVLSFLFWLLLFRPQRA